MSEPRLVPLAPEALAPDQRALYDAILASPRGQGPLGVVVAVAVGLWASGVLGVRGAVLALWLLPLPSVVARALSPGLEVAMGNGIGAMLPGIDFDSAATGRAFVYAGERLRIEPLDGGLALGFGLASVGWARAVVAGRSLSTAIASGLAWGTIGLPLQFALMTLTAGAVVRGFLDIPAARGGLDHAGAIAVIVAGLAFVRAGRRNAERLGGGIASREGAQPC